VIIARSMGSLIAQTFVSSHPASGLVLISPPSSNSADSVKALLPSPLPEFDFEPRFPISLVSTEEESDMLRKSNRLAQDADVDVLSVQNVDSQEAFVRIEQWLDEVGI
jgi:pimeloyl-ACP methyl ester carboxylesterase